MNEGAAALSALGRLRDALTAEFPNTFGGLYMSDNTNPHVTIVVVGDDTAQRPVERFVDDFMRRVTPRALELVQFRYSPGPIPRAELLRLQALVTGDMPEWAARGLRITGVGVDDRAGKIHVMIPLDAADDDYVAPFADQYNPAVFVFYRGEARLL